MIIFGLSRSRSYFSVRPLLLIVLEKSAFLLTMHGMPRTDHQSMHAPERFFFVQVHQQQSSDLAHS